MTGRRKHSAAAIALAAAVWSCGYSLVRPASTVPQAVKTVYVDVRGAPRADVEMVDALGRELRRLLRRESRFRVVEDRDGADATLAVELFPARVEPVAFDEFDEVLDYEMTLRARARLENARGEAIWSAAEVGATRGRGAVRGAIVTTSSAFQSTERLTARDLESFDNVQLGEVRRAHAAETLAADLARTILARLNEGR
ncbi:MAG: hypothetical protein D6815_04865 [Candidatus Dadabacteria bacterium]|nr:MAG: hypothetical protein D6815_04865 [Candidatus Dadabacteria bacterium]